MSWNQLLDIYKENSETALRSKTEPPTACPNDGTPLESGPDGQLHCKFDGWQYPRDK